MIADSAQHVISWAQAPIVRSREGHGPVLHRANGMEIMWIFGC